MFAAEDKLTAWKNVAIKSTNTLAKTIKDVDSGMGKQMQVLVILLYFLLLQFYWHRQPLYPKWSARLNWPFLLSEGFSLWCWEQRDEIRGGGCALNTAPWTETDLGSSPLHDECKQTILRRISAVESADNVQCVCATRVWRRRSLMGMWVIAGSHHHSGTTAAVTHRRVIQILVFGWRRAKNRTPCCIGWPWPDLFRSANAVTETRVITCGLNAKFTIRMRGRRSAPLCPTERGAGCVVIMQNINSTDDFGSLCVFLFLQDENREPRLIYMSSERERHRAETENTQ